MEAERDTSYRSGMFPHLLCCEAVELHQEYQVPFFSFECFSLLLRAASKLYHIQAS
jgi:hypothetical protein